MGALGIIPMQAANPSSSKDNITGTMPKPLVLPALRCYAGPRKDGMLEKGPLAWDVAQW